MQATIVSAVAFGLLGVEAAGSTIAVVLLAIATAILGMALGLLASAFAQTEFQAGSSCPHSSSPSLRSGLFVPREQMAPALEALSYALPMSYAFDALERVTADGCSAAAAGSTSRHHRCHPARAGARRGDAARRTP